MDFGLTDEQSSIRDEIAAFASAELNDDLVVHDADSTFDREAWKKCAAVGIQGLAVPEEYGGSEADPVTILAAMEGLGFGCRDNGLIFSLNAHMWSCEVPIVAFGSPAQKAKYLPRLADGSQIGVQAMTEPGSGSDAFSMSTVATAVDGGYSLTGSKTFITNAPVADVFVVFARMAERHGFGSISAFLVDRDTPRLSVGKPFHKMGLRTSPMSEVVFDDCRISGDALLGRAGSGALIFGHSMDWERSCILASAIGTMQRQLDRCIAYAKERTQFGRPIGSFQSVSNRIVDMKLRLETSRLLLYQQGWRKTKGRTSPADAALVKLHVSESFVQSSLDALQIHGGSGYMTETELEREVRDAIGSRIYSGTSDMQRNIVARFMGLD